MPFVCIKPFFDLAVCLRMLWFAPYMGNLGICKELLKNAAIGAARMVACKLAAPVSNQLFYGAVRQRSLPLFAYNLQESG